MAMSKALSGSVGPVEADSGIPNGIASDGDVDPVQQDIDGPERGPAVVVVAAQA
jgi:hypothetical protein